MAESPAGSTREEPHIGDNMPLNRRRTLLETRPVRSIELASRRSALLLSYYRGDVLFHCDEAN